MAIEVKTDGENLIFEDYGKRKVTIKQDDYLELMSLEEKRAVRPALEDCLKDPTEVWWNKEEIEAVDYYYYKYIKLFSNLVFVAFVVIDDASNFELNNFYGYHENEFNLAEQERKGQLILSNSR